MPRHTESGLPFEPVYGPEALDGWDPVARLGTPGDYPYTRGVYSSMYTGRPWTMRQYAGFGTAAESNARYQQLIAAGVAVATHVQDCFNRQAALEAEIDAGTITTPAEIDATTWPPAT